MPEVKSDEVLGVSPVFGDISAKVRKAALLEIESRLRQGLPVVVDRGRGIEELTAEELRHQLQQQG